MKRQLLIASFLSLVALPARAQTPGLYSHSDESLTWGQTSGGNVTAYVVAMEPGTVSGNTAIVNVILGTGTTPSGLTVTDNASGGSNSYSLVNSQADSTNSNFVYQYCAVQSHAGATLFTVTATTNLGATFVKASVTQYYNLSCAVDQTWGQRHAASTTWSCGSASKSTSTANDVIHGFFWESFGASVTKETSFTASSGSQLVDGSGQIWDLNPQSWGVYAAGSYNPSITVSNSAAYIAACVALKPTSSGGAPPSTPYVIAVEHGAVACIGSLGPCNTLSSGSTIAWQMPTSASSSIVLLFTGGNTTDYPLSCTSSVSGESPVVKFSQTGSGGSGSTAIMYILNASASQSRQITCTPDATPINEDTYIFVEIANGQNITYDTGGQGTGTQNTTNAAITYTVGPFGETNPIVLSVLAVNNGGVSTSTAASGVNYLHGSYSTSSGVQCPMNLTPPNMIDECNGMFTSFPSSSSSFSITGNISVSGESFGPYAYAWIAFNPNTGGGGTTIIPALPTMGVGVGDRPEAAPWQ